MSNTDNSSSTDSDNNNGSPFFNHYLGYPQMFNYGYEIASQDIGTDNSSESEIIPNLNSWDSTSSDSETLLNSSSEELDSPENDSSHSSRNPSIIKLFNQRKNNKIKITNLKSNYSSLPKELYSREIGQYNHRAQWGYKFYQSLFAVQKLKLSKQLKSHQGCVNSLDFNKTGEIITSGSDDLRICLWDWTNAKCLLNYRSLHTRNIFQTKFLTTQGESHIVSSGRDGKVVLAAINNHSVVYSKIIARHDRSCNKVGVHHDTPYVVLSCGDDGIVKNIDIRESPINENERITNILHIKNSHGTSMLLYGIDINPMKPYEFIVNGDDEYVRMYDKRRLTGNPIKIFQRELKNTKSEKTDNIATNRTDDNGAGNSASTSNVDSDFVEEEVIICPPLCSFAHITSAVYSYCGTEILASYSEGDIYLFDARGRSNSILHSYSGHLNRMTIKGVNFYGPRSDYVISGSDCGFIFIWDKKTEAIVQRKHADKKGCANVLEAHPHMPTLATSGLDSTIKIWEPLNISKQPNKNKLKRAIIRNRLDRDRYLRIEAPRFNLRPIRHMN